MSMKAAKWSGVGESNVNEKTSEINAAGISRHLHSHEFLAHGRLPHVCLPHARLLDGSDVQAEMLHTRIQSINFQQAQSGPVSIERHFAGRDFANSNDGFERSTTQSFAAQSMWSYLHAIPVEAKLK
jgi:hypothetical protein